MNPTTKAITINIVLPLIIGSFIYIGFRNNNLKMFHWFENFGASNFIGKIRQLTINYRVYLPTWIYYSLPDALWTYSFSSAYLILWKGNIKAIKYWLLLPFVFSCMVELGQAIGIVRGTFDIVDLILCFLAIIVSVLIFNQTTFKYEKTKHIENL